jgi:hypothetical protein
MIDLFAAARRRIKLLANATLRTPDITFEQEAQLAWAVYGATAVVRRRA